MATMRLENTTLSIGGVDLSYRTTVELDNHASTSDADRPLAALEGFAATFTGQWDGPPLIPGLPVERTWRITFPAHVVRRWLAMREQRRRVRQARLRRMHSAYRAKRHGRW